MIAALAAGAITLAGAAGPEPFDADGRWGYKDEAGQTLIAPVYASAGNFSDGVAEVRLPGGDWAVIDRAGAGDYPGGVFRRRPLQRETGAGQER